MKKVLIGLAALATIMMSGQTQAADIGYRQYAPAPAPVPAWRWMGPYIGANVGYQWGTIDNNPAEPAGVSGGLQAGYNWQNGNFVFGAEGDINITNADDTFAPWKFSNPWFGTLRGRLGIAAWSGVLFYGTGGLAFGGLEAETWGGLSESRTHLGWTVGAGAEVALNQNWSVKAEYLYLSLAERGYTVTGADNGFNNNLLRFGVNYRF
ncbi:outer membrane protein [Pseudorhodoplanes sp.]|uniref:outer membrane protein n=1 Tax=Pseudorhodoplanes sp. TaxID=1934341 RepID=UPI00391B12B5